MKAWTVFGRGVEAAGQRETVRAACVARGWDVGVSVRRLGSGLRGWGAVVRLVRRGGYDVVVVDELARVAATPTGVRVVLAMLARSGVSGWSRFARVSTPVPVVVAGRFRWRRGGRCSWRLRSSA